MDLTTMKLYAMAVPFLLSAILGWMFIPRVLILSHRKRLFDIPDERKMHNQPIPRLGGITFLPILLMCVCIVLGSWVLLEYPVFNTGLQIVLVRFLLLFVGMMMLYLVGVVDDLIGVSYQAKFMVQIVCATFFPISGLWIHNLSGFFWCYDLSAWVGIPVTVIAVVYITNAINLIDGVDGLASGLCFLALFTFGIAASLRSQYLFMIICFAMLGVLLPFWLFNVFGNVERGHKIFMGDTGSLTLGYLVSFLFIYMASGAGCTFPREMFIIGLSTMLLPMFDIVRVVMARIRNHKNPFLPDKNHIHHKLLRTGIGPRITMAVIALVSLLIVSATLVGVFYHIPSTWIFLIDVAIWLAFDYSVNYFIYRNHRQRFEK